MKPDRCRIVPLPDHQVAFEIDGEERLRWHFGRDYPRPFFFPLIGPSGHTLTRMGHPGAGNHDHHRSIWFAHAKALGIDFWSDNGTSQIRQLRWLVYQDGADEMAMAVELGWYDGHDPQLLLTQEVIATVRPYGDKELTLELQSTFQPAAASFEFQKTNFGFLAVRVAKSIAAHFGEGKLINSEGAVDEKAIFGKPARWMDYSGPVGDHLASTMNMPTDGVTYFDHPSNPAFPNRWHVREDGWLGCSACFSGPLTTTKEAPLQLRYLLHAHAGQLDRQKAEKVADQFGRRPATRVVRAKVKHQQYALESM